MIKFRGKRRKDGQWIEGDLVYWNNNPDDPCIQTEMYVDFGQPKWNAYAVEPETIEMIKK